MLFSRREHTVGPTECANHSGYHWLFFLQEEFAQRIIVPASTSVRVLKVKAVGRAHRSCACQRCSSDR